MQLEGLHHVTAITGNASLNVAFYTQVLGLHLVKKTVNQDDVSAYHLFYGDETGGPAFSTDEDPSHLGEQLALPPFLEPQRQAIEEHLRPFVPFHLANLN